MRRLSPEYPESRNKIFSDLLHGSLLSSTSLLQCQVNDWTIAHVVIGQGVGILDKNALKGSEMHSITQSANWHSERNVKVKKKGLKLTLTSYCNFCFPAGMPVASWILTLMTDTCGDIALHIDKYDIHLLKQKWGDWVGGVKSQHVHTWSVSGTVKFNTWPFNFHSVLSCMLGTCTLTATGPWRGKRHNDL